MSEEFEKILSEEEVILDSICESQKKLRLAVEEKEWGSLMALISQINLLSDSFKRLDSRRESLQSALGGDQLSACRNSLSRLRSKLLRCKAENKAFASYVNISRAFVQQVLERALPQSRNKNYSRSGSIVQPQPHSVVVNQLL